MDVKEFELKEDSERCSECGRSISIGYSLEFDYTLERIFICKEHLDRLKDCFNEVS